MNETTDPANLPFDERIEASLALLSPAEQRMARFFIEEKEAVLLGSAAQIAAQAGARFPSIEKKYGRPIPEWIALVQKSRPAKHMELVAILKEQHGIGHGHANAIVAHTLSQNDTSE